MIETLSSGIRIQMLIQNHHAEILGRERNNNKSIHLYNTGTYWIAFEQSACQLNSIFPRCEINLLVIPGHPGYVVMASVPSAQANAYFRTHIARRDELDYKVLTTPPLPAEDYYRWHVQVVEEMI